MPQARSPDVIAVDRLRMLEGAERGFYRDDGRHRVPTVGVGYTPVVRGAGGRWRLREDVRESFRAAGIALTDRHMQALRRIETAMNGGAAMSGDVDRAIADLADIDLSPEQQAALARPVLEEARRYARNAIGADLYDRLDPSRQAELMVGAYHSPRAITEAGPDLAAAIRDGDWEAFAARWQAIGHTLGDVGRYRGGAERLRNPDGRGFAEVKAGDTLSGIARRHGVQVDDLVRANPHIVDPDRIRAGDMLQLPHARERQGRDAALGRNAPDTVPLA